MDNIKVMVDASALDQDTVLVTAAQNEEWIEKRSAEIMRSALEQYGSVPQSSVIPGDVTTRDTISLALIDELADGLNSSKDNTLKVDAMLLQMILEDAYFGTAYQAIVSNINTDYKIVFGTDVLEDADCKELEQVRDEVDYFARSVDFKQLIRDVISRVYAEGTASLVMRCPENAAPVIDIVPLSIAYPSDYLCGGRSVVEFDMKQLKDKLNKTYKKSKKTRKAIYFENMKAEVKANYPPEVYKAFVDGEDYVKLDPAMSDCVKINDLGRRFGVSPLFRCLRPLVVLRQIEAADVSDSKARAKKILFQKMRKEILGSDGTRRGLDQTAFAHQQGVSALKTSSCFYTANPAVESLEYVQIKNTSEESVNQQKLYTQKLLTGLGITYSDPDSTVGSSNISLKQIIRLINSISENLESAINKFLATWVAQNGHDLKFVPTISIGDASALEPEMRKELASFAYTVLNLSRRTASELLDLDYEDERARRIAENEANDEDVFFPRKTSYTANGENTGGRPSGKETDRQAYDETYSDTVRL